MASFDEVVTGLGLGVRFRPTVDADLPFLSALYASTRAAELAPLPWPDEAKRAFLADQFLLQHRHYRNAFADADFLLILREEQPIGRVYVHRSREQLELIEITLVEAERGRGLGTTLIRELLAEAGRDARTVQLYVEPHNPARRLYERMGFQLVEQQGVYDLMQWSPPPAR